MILKIDLNRPDRRILGQAVEALSAGDLVVAPTETRYGLLARADDQAVLEKLYRLKERDINLPTALLVSGRAEIDRWAEVDETADRLIGAFLPGPLTLVLPSRVDWPPPRVTDGKIGFRWSSSPVIEALVSRVDFPLTATSANLSGRGDPESVEQIDSVFRDRVAVYLDGGQLTGKTSTVVECTDEKVIILRDGALSRADVERVIATNV